MGDRLRRHGECFGCGLCLLACPLWRAKRDIRLSAQGCARALQCGARADELADAVDSCSLCGACEPACPAQIGLVAMIVDLRAELARHDPERVAQLHERMNAHRGPAPAAPAAAVTLVPDKALKADCALLGRVAALLGKREKLAVAEDDGADIALALETGAAIPAARRARFLAPLARARRIIIGDGLLFRALRSWLPRNPIETLGVAISSASAVRGKLRAADLYVIEPRAYHADHARLVRHYAALRLERGCSMNLDLQRLAIPTTAGSLAAILGRSEVDARDQARWILEGAPECSRIVVEDLQDVAAFTAVTGKPVVHLAQIT